MSDTSGGLSVACFFLMAMSMAGLVHVWWLRSRFSRRWRQPLDCGWRVRGRRVFGDNKMLRGFMVLPATAAISFPVLFSMLPEHVAASIDPLASCSLMQLSAIGFASGCGFMLGELPNSFIKRQLDIAPGTAATVPVLRCTFALVDRVDSTIAALFVAGLLIPLSALSWFWTLIIGPGLHALFSAALHKLGVKDRAW